MAKTDYLPINPQKAYPKVFIFHISKGLKTHGSVYEATRQAWRKRNCLLQEPLGIAVGVNDGISVGVFEILSWHPSQEEKKWKFEGKEIDDLLDYDYSKITSEAGYWQRGNYLGVEFDGKGHFRFFLGKKDKGTWYPL